MKASVLSLLLAGLVAAQDFSGQPECAIPCLKDAIPKAGCALEDTACACKPDVQAKLVGLVGPCLISKCSPSDLAKAQAAAADACKKNAGGSTEAVSGATTTTGPSSETTASAAETTTEAGTTTDAGTTSEATTAPATTTAVETTAAETTATETTVVETTTAATSTETTVVETTTAATSTGASAGPTIQPSGPSGVSNSTVSGTRSVVTRISTAFVGGDGGSRTSGIPASTTLAGSDATAPVAGVLGAVLAALMAL